MENLSWDVEWRKYQKFCGMRSQGVLVAPLSSSLRCPVMDAGHWILDKYTVSILRLGVHEETYVYGLGIPVYVAMHYKPHTCERCKSYATRLRRSEQCPGWSLLPASALLATALPLLLGQTADHLPRARSPVPISTLRPARDVRSSSPEGHCHLMARASKHKESFSRRGYSRTGREQWTNVLHSRGPDGEKNERQLNLGLSTRVHGLIRSLDTSNLELKSPALWTRDSCHTNCPWPQ
jgi:hypothetical protein